MHSALTHATNTSNLHQPLLKRDRTLHEPSNKSPFLGAAACVKSALRSILDNAGFLLFSALCLSVIWLAAAPGVNPGRITPGDEFASPPARSAPKPLPSPSRKTLADDLRRIIDARGAELAAEEEEGRRRRNRRRSM